MFPRYLLCYFCKTLLQGIFVLDVQPEYGRVAVLIPLRVCNSQLGLADSTKPLQNDGATATIATKCIMHLLKLFISSHKVFNVRNIGETEGHGKVLSVDPYAGQLFVS